MSDDGTQPFDELRVVVPRILQEGRRLRARPSVPTVKGRPSGEGPRSFHTGSLPPTRDEDDELHRVADELRRLDPTGARTATVIRRAFDQAYDGRRTGRWDFTQLMKTEKTHVGTLLEIWLAREFQFDDGDELDFRIAGVDVDCKWSMNLYGWEIPLEMHVRGPKVALLIWGNEYSARWASGLLRIDEQVLRPPGKQRDQKRRLSDEGRDQILWLHRDGEMIHNTLVDHPTVALEVASACSGQKAIDTLFRRLQGVLVNQATVEVAAQQIDSAKRVRDARRRLRAEGIVIFGHYAPHPQWAAQLGLPIPTLGRFVSARLVPASEHEEAAAVHIGGRTWRLARPDDPPCTAPLLPGQGKDA